MPIDRTRELWRDPANGETFAVELEGDRVISALGPLDKDSGTGVESSWTAPSRGREAGFTELAADLARRREDFERRAAPA